MDFIKKNKKYITWAGCAIMAIAVFLTFMKMSAYGHTESIKFSELTKGGNEMGVISGWIVLVAAIASAVLIYLKKEKISLATTGAALVIAFYDFFKINGDSSIKAVKALGAKVSYVAPWIVLVGAILAAGPIVIDILEEKGIIKSK